MVVLVIFMDFIFTKGQTAACAKQFSLIHLNVDFLLMQLHLVLKNLVQTQVLYLLMVKASMEM